MRTAAVRLALALAFTAGHAAAQDMDMSKMDMPKDETSKDDMPAMMHGMAGSLGSYTFNRDASGTSWQPDSSVHEGLHIMSGDWMYMAHARFNAGYDWQQGPRGGEGTIFSGMVMGTARKTFADDDAVTFRAMLSPDPVMGPKGYPLLLASGETADSVTHLVDRQHPHDLFMELSASYRHQLTDNDSLFVYAGWPGEPAFGPPAFMHRLSIMDSPEAPISHHWLDSTHITFGVITGGLVHGDWKLEASGFKGREPDAMRTDIENAKLDSASVRASWNPTSDLSLQVSWAKVTSPEQLEPADDQKKLSASVIYTRQFEEGWWSTTLAWGRRQATDAAGSGPALNAWALESAFKPAEPWTLFARAETTETDELNALHRIDRVAKVSAGAIHDWQVGVHAVFGLGALYARNWVPGVLKPAYGGNPRGGMVFARLLVK